MESRFLRNRILIILLVLFGWPGMNALSQVTACDGGTLTGSELMDAMVRIPGGQNLPNGHRNDGAWSFSSVPAGSVLSFSTPNESAVVSGFDNSSNYTVTWAPTSTGHTYSVNVTVELPPLVQKVNGSNQCAPNSSTLQMISSQAGVEYVVRYNNGGVIQYLDPWTSLADNTPHSFGPYTGIGTYSVVARGCNGDVTMNGSYSISNFPDSYTITSTPNPACAGSDLVLNGSQTDVDYYLLLNGVRTGAIISPGSGNSITFGGLSSAGLYTVEGEREGCVRPMNGWLRIQATPQQFTLSANKNSYCSGVANTGVELSLDGSQSGIKYQLQRETELGYVDYRAAVDGTNNALTPAWQNISKGTYRVVASTSAGCFNDMIGRPMIVETVPPTAVVTTSSPNTRCAGEVVDFYINVKLTGAPPFNFDIVNNIEDPVISVSNHYSDTYSVKVNPGSSATYTLTNLTDASSCEPELNVGQVQFFVRPLPVFNFSSSPNAITDVVGLPTTNICNGSPVTLEINATGTNDYYWSHGLGNFDNVTFTPDVSGTYEAAVEDVYGCRTTKEVRVNVNPLPVIDFNLAGGDNEVCENEGVIPIEPVAPNIGGSFSGPGVSGSFFDPADAGASLTPHYITYTFQNASTGCVSTLSKPVIVHPEPNVSVLGNQTNFCADQVTGTLRGVPENINGRWVLAAGAKGWFTDNGDGRATIDIVSALADAGESSYTADYIYTNPTTGCVSDGNYHTFTVRNDLSDDVDFRLLDDSPVPTELCQDGADIDLKAFLVSTDAALTIGNFSGPGISDNGNGTAVFSPEDAGTGTHTINYSYTDPATLCTGYASHIIQIGTTLTFNGPLNPIYCKEDGAFQIHGDPGPGTLEIFFESEATARFTQLNNSSINQFTITPTSAAWESGDYRAVFTYSDGCDNVIEYAFTIREEVDAIFSVKDDQKQFCVTQNPDPYNHRIELLPVQAGGTFTINTPSGEGVEPNGTFFYPDLAQPGEWTITYTIETGSCTDTYSLPVVVVPNPMVSISNLSDSYCENVPDFSISASNLPVVDGASYTFSATANAAGRVPIYASTKGDLDTDKEIDDTNVNFSPSYVGPGTYYITYVFDNTTNTGCLSTFEKEVEILEAPDVDFGVSDPVSGTTFSELKFCQNENSLVLAGDIFTDPSDPLNMGEGYFSGVGVDNVALDGPGSENNGRALFDPSMVSASDDHSITYNYTHFNGCQTARTRTFDILPAPLTHYKVVSDPVSGVYCFDAAGTPPSYGVEIGLEFSQPGVTYHLLRNGAPTVPSQTVAGEAAGTSVNFPNRVTEPGTYTVRAVFTSPPPTGTCSDIMNGSVEVRMNYVTGSIEDLQHESCSGLEDGYLRISAGGGTAPYVFTLRDAELTTIATSATGEFSGLEPGAYTVHILDAVGCDWTSGNITVNAGSSLTLDVVPTSVIQLTCNGVNSASFTVEAGGLFSGNYEFRRDLAAPWVSHGSNIYTFTDLAAGTYVVSVRDADSPGCQASEIVVINPEPAAITLVSAPTLTPVGCSETPVGGIELRAQGGIGSGEFHYVLYELKPWGDWVPVKGESENVGIAASFSDLNGGDYRVDITDDNGCGPLQVPITIDAAASQPVVQLSGDGIVHVSEPGLSDGSIQIAITGGEVPYSIVWSGVEPDGTLITTLTDDVYRQENLFAGTYKVTVSDGNGCPAELDDLEVVENADFKIVVTKGQPGPCYGSSNGEINLSVTGGVLPYQSLTLTNSAGDVLIPHSSGGSFAHYNILSAGNYTAVAIDDRGVSVSEPIQLVGPTAPVQLAYTKTDATCFGGNGSVAFSATGGTPTAGTPNTYSYLIIPTSGTSISGTQNEGGNVTRTLSAGNYQLTVTDGVTCFDAVSFTINEPSQMGVVVEDVQNIKCHGASNGSISVSVDGRPGGTAFNFEWQSGTFDGTDWTWTAISGSTATIADLAAGSYRVRAFEPGNPSCISDWSGTITINQPLAPMVVTPAVNNITTCHGDASGSIVLSVTGGTAPYIIKLGTNEYLWDGLNPYVLGGLSVGTYNIEVVDDNGCPELLSASVTEPAPFVVSNFDYGIKCDLPSSGYVAFDISGGRQVSGTNSYHALLVRNDNNQVYYNEAVGANNDPLVDDLIAGTYTIRIWDVNSSNPSACLFEQQFVLRNISVSANVVNPTCLGQDNGSIELTVEGGSGSYSFNWVDDGSTDPHRYGLAPGTYEVNIGDTNEGCTITLDYTIAYQNTLSVAAAVSDVTCHGGSNGSITATANGGVAPYNYLWEKHDGSVYVPLINAQTLSNQSVGNYKVTVTDFNGCQVSEEDIEIKQPANFTIDDVIDINTVSCFGGNDGSFTVVPNRAGNFEYSIDGVSWQVSPTFSSLVAGGYQVAMRDLDQPGPVYCARYDVEYVVIVQPAALAVSEKSITNVTCFSGNDGAIEVAVGGGTVGGDYTYQWYRVTETGNIALTLGSVNPANLLTAGDYRVRVSDDKSCSIWSEVYTLTEPASAPEITVVVNNSVTTPGGNDGSISISIAGGTPGYVISWTSPGGYTASGVASIFNLVEGTYTASVLDSQGCLVTREITVSDPDDALQLSLLSAVNPVLCPVVSPGSIELEANGGTEPYTFTLTKRPGIIITTGIQSANYITYTGLDAGIYDARVVDDNGVVYEVSGITLEVPDALDLSIVNVSDPLCFGESNGEVSFTVQGGTPYDNGSPADPSDDYHDFVLVSEAGLPSINGQVINNVSELIGSLPAGDYLLTVTDSKGCSASTDFTVAQPDVLSISVDDIIPVSCNGGNNGAISTIVNGRPGGSLFTYSWEFSTDQSTWSHYPGTSLSISGLEAGWYRVTAEETASSCSVTSSDLRIDEPAAVALDLVQENDISTCHGDASGSIVLSVSGGTAPYLVKYGTVEESWDGLSNYVASGLVAGDYSFEVTDALGCTSNTVAGSIQEPVLFDVNIGSGINCDTDNSGWIKLEISGGRPVAGDYNYQVRLIRKDNNQVVHSDDYTSAETPVNIPGLEQGDYLVYIWDLNSTAPDRCRHTFEVELRNVVVNANIVQPTCAGQDNGSIAAIVTGGSGNFSYAWTGPGTFTSTLPLIDNLEPGTYELTVMDLDNGCYMPVHSYDLAYSSVLAVDVDYSDEVSCHGGSDGWATALPSGGTAPYFFLWERQDGVSWTPLTNTATLSNRAAGTYRVRVTDSNNCQLYSDDVVIGEPADFSVASIDYDPETVSCNGGTDGSFTVNIDRTGNFEYSIDGVNWQILPTFEGLAPGSYRISVRDMDRPAPYCAKYEVATATILEAAPVVLSLVNQENVSCFEGANGVLEIEAQGGTVVAAYDYQWYKVTPTGNIPQSGKTNAEANGLTAGSYFVEVWDDHDCLAVSETFTLTQPADPIVVTESNVQHVSATGGSNGSITIAVSGGTPGYSIEWYAVGDPGTLLGTGLSLSGLSEGDYRVVVTDIAIGGPCSEERIIKITEPGTALGLTEVIEAAGPCHGASNGSIELTASGGAGGYTFTLLRQAAAEVTDNVEVSGNRARYTGLSAGLYTARVRDANGNLFELLDLEVGQPTPLEIYNFTFNNVSCFGVDDGSLSFSIRGGTPDGSGDYAYVLVRGNGSKVIGSRHTPVEHDNLVPDDYVLTVYDATNACFAEERFTITEPADIAVLEHIVDVSCFGGNDGSIRIEASGGASGAFAYKWQVEDETSPGAWSDIADSNTEWLQNRVTGNYRVEVTDLGSTCTVLSEVWTIGEPDELVIVATPSPVNTCKGDNSGRIEVWVEGGIGPYVVDYGSGTVSGTGPEFFIEDLVADTYTLVVRDRNGTGCQATTTVEIEEPAAALAVSEAEVSISCVDDNESFSVEFKISGGVAVDLGGVPVFSYHIEVINLLTSGRRTKDLIETADQLVSVNLDDLSLPAGEYRVIVSDLQAASSAACAAVETSFAYKHLNVQNIIGHESCPGAFDGSIDLSVSGGSGDYTYAWTKGGTAMTQTTQDLSGLEAGTYTVTITDVGEPAGRCTYSQIFTVNRAKELLVEGSVQDVSCFDGSNGAIRIHGVANATLPLTYFWNGSAVAGSAELTGLSAGSYSVEILDGDGCRVQEFFTIEQPDAPLDVSLSSELACTSDTRSIKVRATDGTGPYTYQWMGPGAYTRAGDGATIEGITRGGTWQVEVTDAMGCKVVETIVVHGKVRLSAELTHINCEGGKGGNIVLDVSGGSGSYAYSWTRDGASYPVTTKDLNNLEAGKYQVVVTDLSQRCLGGDDYIVESDEFEIVEPDDFVVAGNVTHNECYGSAEGAINLHTVTGGTAPYRFEWTTGDGSGLNPAARNQSGLTAGTYYVRVIDDRGCSSDQIEFEVEELPELFFDLKITDTDCEKKNSIRIIDVSGGTGTYRFFWDGPGIEGGTELQKEDLPGGSYTITMVDMGTPARCSFSRTLELTKPLEVSYVVLPETCSGMANGAITLDVKGGKAPYSFVWEAAAGIEVNDRNQAALPAETYKVTVTDSRDPACELTVDIELPLLHDLELQAAVDDVECFGGNNGAIYLSVLNGSGIYSYQWTKGGFNATTKDLSDLEAGTYRVVVTDEVLGCTVSGVFEVLQPEAPMAITVDDVQHNKCFGARGGAISVTVSGGTGSYTFLWDGPGNLANPSLEDQTGLAGGDYYLTVTDAKGCTLENFGPIRVDEPAAPVSITLVEVTPVTAKGANDGSITVQVSGGSDNGLYDIIWTDEDDVELTTFADQTFANGLPGGTYTISVEDDNECSAVLEVFVFEPGQALALSIDKQASGPCYGSDNGKLWVQVQGGLQPYASLTLSDGTGVLKDLEDVSTAVFADLEAGDYTVTVTDALGHTVTQEVEVHEAAAPLVVTAAVTEQVACRGAATGEITARVTGGMPNASGQYQLILAGGPAGTSESIAITADITTGEFIHVFDELPKGTYTVRVIDDSNVLRVKHDENDLQALFGDGVFDLGDDCTAAQSGLIVRQPEAVVHLSVEPGSEEVCAGVEPRLVAATSGWDFVVGGALEVILSNGDDFVLTAASQVLTLTTLPLNAFTSYTILSVTSAADVACSKGEGTGQATVVMHERPTASLSGTTTVCAGETASLNMQLTGTAPWQVSYNDGASTFWINDITTPTYQLEVSPTATTTYTVETVADANCTGTASGTASVTVPVVSTVEFVGDASRDICAGESEILEVVFDPESNGPWQLTYSAQLLVSGLPSGAPLMRTVTVDAATMFNAEGHYEIQVRPSQTIRYRLESVVSGGCAGTVDGLPIDVLVGQLPAQPGAIVGSVEVCQGATATFSVPALPGVSHYVWTLPGGVEVESGRELTTTFAEDAVSGRLSVYAVNACGDGPLQYMDLVINPLPDASDVEITGPEDICQGRKGVVFTVDAIPHAETYNWSLTVGTIVSGQGSAQISVDFADEVDYFNGVVSVQAENDCGIAVDLVSKAFRVRPLPVPNAGADQSLCEDFVTLDATPLTAAEVAAGAKGFWRGLLVSGSADAITDLADPKVTVTGLSRGDVTFRWMVTNQYGCESYDDVTVRNNQLLVSAWAENALVCDGKAQLRGTNPDASLSVSGQWTVVEPVASVAVFDNATSPSALVSNMSPGRNVFRWTLNQNACASSAKVEIMNNQPAEAVINGPAIVSTCGDPVTLEAEAPGVDWGTGSWSVISGYAHIVWPNRATTVVKDMNFGDTELQWTVTKGHCQNTARVIIRNNKVWVDAGDEQDLCSASTILEGSPVPAGASGSWHVIKGAATFANGSNPATAVSALGRGENVLEWRINKNGCTSSDQVSIWNNSATAASVGSALTVCNELPTLSGNEPLLSEETGYWSVVSGRGAFEDASKHHTQVSDLAFGENVFRWTINNNDKCSSSADLRVTNLKTFVDAGKDTVICANPVILRANPVPAGMTGTWNIVPGEGGGTIVEDDPSRPNIIRVGLDQGPNMLEWTINNRGCYSTDRVVVVNSRPYPVDGGSPRRVITGTTAFMDAVRPGARQTGTWLLLSGGADIREPNNPITQVLNLRRGENVFRWVVTNGYCSDYADVVIVNGDVVDANAGRNQVICGSTTRLDANDPEGALGAWTRVKGTAVFENPYDPRTQVSNLAPGENILRWTISYGSSGSSTSSSDEVVIYNNQPATARTMDDVVLCDDNLTIRANEPGEVGSEPMGTPFWEIVSGGGEIVDPNAPETSVNDIAKGENVLVYTITKVHEGANKVCPSSDTLRVINGLPTTPVAGEDRTICSDEYRLSPNVPEHGVGRWRSGSVGGATFDGNRVYNLAPGENELIYEIATEWCTLESRILLTNNKPSDSFAGKGRDWCQPNFTMEAHEPQYGIGTWEKVSGGGVIAPEDLNNPVAEVTGLTSGSNRFRWVVDNNGCPSVSEVEIRYNFIAADAGDDFEICEDFTFLNGSNPMEGTGTWGVKGGSGSAIFEDVNDPLTRVSGLDRGPNVLTWTVNNVNCPSVSEVLVYNNKPTVPEAGDNQSGLCEPETILQGNAPAAGVGRWTVISGSATFNSETYTEAELDPNARVSGLSFGPNTLRWTISTEGQNAGYEGCSLSDEVVLTYNKVEAFAGNDRAACADEMVLSARNPSPGTGMWSVPGGQGAAVFEDPTSPNTRVYNLGRGQNTLRWTVWHNGCSTYDEVVIDNQLPSLPYAGNEQPLCTDETVLDATPPEGGSTGSWRVVTGSAVFEDETDPKTAVSGLSKGDNIFIWTTERIEGCVLEDEVLVQNHEPSDPYAGADYEEVCANTFTLKATAPEYGSGIWSFEAGGGNLSDPNDPEALITALNPGRNLLRWTVSQGQCSKWAEVEIINNTPTKANAGPDIEDCKDTQTLDANVPVHFERAYWERISGYGELDDINNPKSVVRNLAFGANEFQWVIENGSCRSTDRVVIFNQIPDKAFAGSDQLDVCDTYTVLNGNDPVTGVGKWSVLKGRGEFDDPHQYNTIVRNLGFGENIFLWEVTYGTCSTRDEMVVVSHKTEAYAGEDQVVYEPEVLLNANNAGELDAQWFVEGNSTAVLNDERFFNTSVSKLSAGINSFRWEINVNGCISSDRVSVDYRPVPDAGFIVDVEEGCYPLRVQFTNYSVGGSQYLWRFGDGSTSADRNPVHVFERPGTFTVQLVSPGPDGQDGLYEKEIRVFDHPVADFAVNPTVVYIPGEKARFYDLSTNAVSWWWDFGDGMLSEERNPSYEYREEGVYDVALTVGNVEGCLDTLIVEQAITAEPQGFVVFPNAFRPRPGGASASGVDPSAEYVVVFKPAFSDVDEFTLEIFNRWGQRIFKTNDINTGWDGMYEGQMAPQAVYVYLATGKYVNGREFRKTGSVLLVR